MLGALASPALASSRSARAWRTQDERGRLDADSAPSKSARGGAADVPRQKEHSPAQPMAAQLTLTSQVGAASKIPSWALERSVPLGPAAEGADHPPVPPLFAPLSQRGILSALVAVLVEEGEPDLQAIIAALVGSRGLRRLPRQFVATTRCGVQVLVDAGIGLDPYREDQHQLVQALDDLLADDRFDVLSFVGCPTRGVQSADSDDVRAWSPPPLGTPILVVSDLGLGGPPLHGDAGTVGEWRRFALRAREAGAAVVALLPYESRRWPEALTRVMTMVHWSERTTVGDVRRAVRDTRRAVRR